MHRVIEETDNQCMIAITSNGTIFPDLKRYPWLQNNPNIVITISVDAVGRAAEFIRTGTDWTRVEKNVKRFQDIGLTVGYHVTHSVLNLFELDAVESWRIANDMPPCQLLTVVSHCDHLSFAVLTPEEKHEVCRYLSDRHGRFLIPYIQSSSYDSRQRKKFEDFMCHTQKYHGLDWRDYLPDLWRLLMPAS
jgi:hypothetical protein